MEEIELRLFRLFKISLKGLWAYKYRSLLAVLGIVVSIATIISLLSLLQGFKQSLIGQIEKGLGMQQIVVTPGRMLNAGGNILNSGLSGLTSFRSSTSTLSLKDVEKVMEKAKAVETGAPQYEAFISVSLPAGAVSPAAKKSSLETILTGTIPAYAKLFSYNPIQGQFLSEEDLRQEKHVVVLGHNIKKDLFGDAPAVGKILKIKGGFYQKILGLGQADRDTK